MYAFLIPDALISELFISHDFITNFFNIIIISYSAMMLYLPIWVILKVGFISKLLLNKIVKNMVIIGWLIYLIVCYHETDFFGMIFFGLCIASFIILSFIIAKIELEVFIFPASSTIYTSPMPSVFANSKKKETTVTMVSTTTDYDTIIKELDAILNEPKFSSKPEIFITCINCGITHKEVKTLICSNCGKDIYIKKLNIKCKQCGSDYDLTEASCPYC